MSNRLGAAACIALMVGVMGFSVANADPVRWILKGASYSDGGQVNGAFTYDAETNAFSDVSVTTTAGTARDAGGPYTVTGYSSNRADFFLFKDAAGANAVYFELGDGLTDQGGTRAFDATVEYTCTDLECGGGNNGRQGQNGIVYSQGVVAPAPIPTLSEWAMILLGLTLAGGAVLYIRRRHALLG